MCLRSVYWPDKVSKEDLSKKTVLCGAGNETSAAQVVWTSPLIGPGQYSYSGLEMEPPKEETREAKDNQAESCDLRTIVG